MTGKIGVKYSFSFLNTSLILPDFNLGGRNDGVSLYLSNLGEFFLWFLLQTRLLNFVYMFYITVSSKITIFWLSFGIRMVKKVTVGTPFVYLASIEALKKGHSRKIVYSVSRNVTCPNSHILCLKIETFTLTI